jgi:hypothetical protein
MATRNRDTYSGEPTGSPEGDSTMRRPLLSTLAFLALATSASAGTLSTPYFFNGGTGAQNVCVAINVGKKPIEVLVEAVPFEGGTIGTETCTLVPLGALTNVPDADGECEASIDNAGYCRFTAPGSAGAVAKSLRAVLINRLTIAPFEIHAVVEAR